MATRRRRPPEPPSIEIKQFTLEEINRGIARIQRRIEEVKALETDQVQYDDQRRYTAEQNIRTAILEVFDLNSPQYQEHQYYQIWHGEKSVSIAYGYEEAYDHEAQQNFLAGIPQAIKMLEGLITWLEEKRAELGQDTTARVRSAFEGLDLHYRIASICVDLYRNGHYRNAVLDASLALMNFVKERSRRHDLDGASLMRTVFSKNDPILAFNDLSDQTDLDEQEGMMHLFEGITLALRNPRAHSLSDDSPEEALEYIALLSLLAKRLEKTKQHKLT